MATPTKRRALGSLIRVTRIAMGLNQSEFGGRLDVGPGTVSRWENGKCDVQARYRSSLAALLGVDEEDLYQLPDVAGAVAGRPASTSSPGADETALTPSQEEFVNGVLKRVARGVAIPPSEVELLRDLGAFLGIGRRDGK